MWVCGCVLVCLCVGVEEGPWRPETPRERGAEEWTRIHTPLGAVSSWSCGDCAPCKLREQEART